MTESLPITILVHDELALHFDKISGVVSKLEAQFNFQTMTANWYGDEHDITYVQLHLLTPEIFTQAHQSYQKQDIKSFSDDVFTVTENNKLLICNIAITAAELALLTQQTKLLSALLSVKLKKVLNLIAEHLSLTVLP
jgi:hypothetical protein